MITGQRHDDEAAAAVLVGRTDPVPGLYIEIHCQLGEFTARVLTAAIRVKDHRTVGTAGPARSL